MLELVALALAIIAITIASYTDFTKRYVPDWVSWGLVAAALTIHVAASIITWDIKPALYSILAAAIFFAIANLTFYTGYWGGGDAKLLIGIAAAIPIYPAALKNLFAPALAPWPFLLSLTANILLLGAAYGLLYMLFKAAINLKKFSKEFIKYAKIIKLKYFPLILLTLPILFLINLELAIILTPIIIFIPLIPIMFTFSKATEATMIYEEAVRNLVPGDHTTAPLRFRGKLIYKPRAIGLTEEDIARIKSICGSHTKIKLRDGIPYAPSFLIGLMFTLIAGDLIVVIANALI